MDKRYRQRPVEVSAVQYTGLNSDDVKGFLGGDFRGRDWLSGDVYIARQGVRDNEEVFKLLEAHPRDWIVRGLDGEHRVVPPGEFYQTYEEVTETVEPNYA